VSKKLEEKQRRRLAEEKKREEQKRAQRRRNLITLVIAIIVTVGVVWLILDESTGKGPDGPSTADYGVSADEAGCGSVESPELQEAKHIEAGTEHDPYSSNPPTSGPHYAAPLAPIDPGFYTNDIEAEKVIHNLEHGMIVIWYRPDAPQATKTAVEAAVDEQPLATVAVPWADIEEGNDVAITAWGKLQNCAQVSKDVVDDFRAEFQGKGPENVGVETFEKP
jgi:hypothetical protein